MIALPCAPPAAAQRADVHSYVDPSLSLTPVCAALVENHPQAHEEGLSPPGSPRSFRKAEEEAAKRKAERKAAKAATAAAATTAATADGGARPDLPEGASVLQALTAPSGGADAAAAAFHHRPAGTPEPGEPGPDGRQATGPRSDTSGVSGQSSVGAGALFGRKSPTGEDMAGGGVEGRKRRAQLSREAAIAAAAAAAAAARAAAGMTTDEDVTTDAEKGEPDSDSEARPIFTFEVPRAQSPAPLFHFLMPNQEDGNGGQGPSGSDTAATAAAAAAAAAAASAAAAAPTGLVRPRSTEEMARRRRSPGRRSPEHERPGTPPASPPPDGAPGGAPPRRQASPARKERRGASPARKEGRAHSPTGAEPAASSPQRTRAAKKDSAQSSRSPSPSRGGPGSPRSGPGSPRARRPPSQPLRPPQPERTVLHPMEEVIMAAGTKKDIAAVVNATKCAAQRERSCHISSDRCIPFPQFSLHGKPAH